jgi:hypothetical protein
MFIPFFGWALARLGCIPVKRGTGKSALDNMVRGTRIALMQGKQVVIFPEGTRTMIGQVANYKTGISHLYTALEVACIPVALNSGALWPRRKFLRPPGTITVEVLSPIPPGLGRKEMFDLMVGKIEVASERWVGPKGIEPTRAAPPRLENKRFGAMVDAKCDGRVNFRGMWDHVGLRRDTPVCGLEPFSRRSPTGQSRSPRRQCLTVCSLPLNRQPIFVAETFRIARCDAPSAPPLRRSAKSVRLCLG